MAKCKALTGSAVKGLKIASTDEELGRAEAQRPTRDGLYPTTNDKRYVAHQMEITQLPSGITALWFAVLH